MSQLLVVVDSLKDWAPYFPAEDVITFDDYLARPDGSRKTRTRVINLCRSYKYLSKGYYCSLLGEARDHHVIPSLRVINDLNQKSLYTLHLDELQDLPADIVADNGRDKEFTFITYFGATGHPELQSLAKDLFEKLPCPILKVSLRCTDRWQISALQSLSPHHLKTDAQQTEFAEALDRFSHKIWRSPKARKQYRYDLAILTNPEEKLPPSDAKAIKRFIKAGNKLGIDVDVIERKDYVRLAEYDALFIRETTAIDHHTFRFAKKAEAEGMVVIDDSTSILRCCNKVYLTDLFNVNKVPAPKTYILSKQDKVALQQAMEDIGFPIVLKIPDGAFSRGVFKVNHAEEFEARVTALFRQSALVLAQEFLYTDFDWRIGVLNHKPLYACRYYMAKDHWQIYNHGSGNGRFSSGGYETMPTYEVPKPVLDAALKATRPIGNSLYGVDIKQSGKRAMVIEVNDNPSIESGVEDQFLELQLYEQIMQEFINRIEARRAHRP
ncbi:MAG: RimK family alpha-L-glutamate ligase [Pseudomonadales bacterium]|nr:RimK family alpha-L-glutamate ligase [Pseudomonadales bacterium]